ncbi:N-acetylmuramoyl-L-alanine amidase [Chryseobacterium aquaticum]|jgi:N-acetylmuramoyl-L-alanine amidase|uniref:N-acetylmuramoyl-L-alanine amidase n=1 Tax=Chryseobacterium aquaticum TaxID=452084 RepID=A0A0Q3KSG5_9FLAO|nr:MULTISPECIES: N-acetylmuramoyl-L-alanine amidase [Chryseobacterium]KNB62463.1 cell wall hydrolase [Chryseobacterium sp. Hurlbut01]KQK27348.1 cell wall hydrolase [Chryseobacterium aquaticum]NMR33870.1 N-acetylmuramoyl-L-alanine amidase [Chryseobacterium aquaticum]NRQ45945.1 N-acetylmuramoyl-L-alanine amidase [Chryseobacterium sp. C-204]
MYTRKFKIILAFLLTLSIQFAYSQKKFTVVLDAGHGGSDHGANRTYSDIGRIAEKDITLSLVLKIGAMLEKNKDFKVIYTRKIDEYPSLSDRTNLANRSKADLFVSVHCNSSVRPTAYGTETFVQGPDQNDTNLEVAKRENDVIYLDEKDKQTFGTYDAKSPESLIALKLQQSKYLESSLLLGGLVEDNFVNKDKRFSRGVWQKNLHVLRMNAMPSVLIETGFINHPEESHYLASEKGQDEISQSIYNAIIDYKKAIDRKTGVFTTKKPEPEKKEEAPLKNDFRILLMTSAVKYNEDDPALKGLNYILPLKENGIYKYYYSVTNMASIRDINIKTAKDAGFRNAYAVGFMPNQKLNTGYYTIEVYTGKDKLSANSFILQTLKDVERDKNNGMFYYTYGKASSLEDAVKLQKELEAKGIKNTVIQKMNK